MSKTIISIEQISEVKPHPNADRLDVVKVLGYQVVTGRGSFEVGDLVIYFPPDILLPPLQARALGVVNYLKHAIFPGDIKKTQCRVGAARLRGIPSHGFCAAADDAFIGTDVGTDLTHLYGAQKYIAPIRVGAGDAAAELPTFHAYTNIENIQRYPNAFKDGDQVIVTEKIHGTNCRLGLVRDTDGEFTFCAGSHNVNRKEGGLYWEFMTERLMNLLSELADERHSVVIFGEIFGPGIQDMDYGCVSHDFRVFDISIDGQYMNYWDTVNVCDHANLSCVPQLYLGLFSLDVVEGHTYGKSTFEGVRGKFKDREGCVIRPLYETYSDVLGGRLIVKSVSADYSDRKGAKDVGE